MAATADVLDCINKCTDKISALQKNVLQLQEIQLSMMDRMSELEKAVNVND